MKLHVGVHSAEGVRHYLARGADEVYGGLASIPNHRPIACQFSALDDVVEGIHIAHSFGKRFFLAINETYSQEQYPEIDRAVHLLVGRGLDGIIIRDIALLARFNAARLNTRFSLSSLGICFNTEALGFYRERYNISRLVLPQHLKPDEARGLIRNGYGVETEVFFFYQCFCRNMDGRCRLHEVLPTDARHLPCETEFKDGAGVSYAMSFPKESDWLGSFYDYHSLGVTCLKVARDSLMRRDIGFDAVLQLVNLVRRIPDKKAFVKEGLKICPRYPWKGP